MPNPLLDLRYLRYAFAAAEHRSFRRTALTLGVPQSTVTRRIQILEARLGADIFLRHRAGVDLTLAGEQFLREARSSVDRLLQSADELASARRGVVGELRIGFVASLNRGGLRDLLAVDGHTEAEEPAIIGVGAVAPTIAVRIRRRAWASWACRA